MKSKNTKMRPEFMLLKVTRHLQNLLRNSVGSEDRPLPSYRTLADEIGVSTATVRRGVDQMKVEGLLRTEHGRGTFIVASENGSTKSKNRKRNDDPAFIKPDLGRRVWGLAYGHHATGLHNAGGFGLIYKSLSMGVSEVGDALLTAVRSGKGDKILPTSEEFFSLGVSGLFLMSVFEPDMQRQYAASGLPCVLLDDVPSARGLDYVVADNRAGVEAMAKRLVKWGHREFAFVSTMVRQSKQRYDRQPDGDSVEREKFLRAALKKHGLDLPKRNVIWHVPARRWNQGLAAEGVLGKDPRPTAVITSCKGIAITMIKILREKGVRVPQDISVASFIEPGDNPHGISGAAIDFEKMGSLGIERLRKRVQGKLSAAAPRRILAPVNLFDGSTWGPVGG